MSLRCLIARPLAKFRLFEFIDALDRVEQEAIGYRPASGQAKNQLMPGLLPLLRSTPPQRPSGQRLETVVVVSGRIGGSWCSRHHLKQFSATLKLSCAMTVAEEAEIPDAVKAIRQHTSRRAQCGKFARCVR